MNIDPKKTKSYLISTGIYLLISLGVYVFYCDSCFTDWEEFGQSLFFSMSMAIALSEGNSRISVWLDKRVSWIEQTLKRVVLGISFLCIYSIFATAIIGYIYIIWILGYPSRIFLPSFLNLLSITLTITFIIVLVSYSMAFLSNWREAAIQAEKLKNEQLSTQFFSLKNQLNPHFLFNSLNALSSLVYKDADQSAKFIKQLSEVYRYILAYSDKEVASLELELACIEAYVFLMKIRFGDNFQISIEVGEVKQWVVAPMSLQMLIENAIKHNVISSGSPLQVDIYREKDYLIVRNNLQKKSHIGSSTGLGLHNIRERYRYLTDQEVVVEETHNQFIVKIPLVSWKDESTHS